MSAVIPGLANEGKLLVIGLAPKPLAVPVEPLLFGDCSIAGWYCGTSIDSQDTLAFAARTGVRSMNEVFPFDRAAEAYQRMMSGKVRFRAVLTMTA
jgi:D-arabinose 1-dehydrogenase-like Zn-dependent alcohol dehydrogenase